MSKKETINKSNNKSTSTISFVTRLVFYTSVILVPLASYYLYNVISSPQAIPELDLNFWWGPYEPKEKRDLTIRPFKIEFSDIMINDLKERLLHRRSFTPTLEHTGFSYGFNTHFLTQVLDYWQNKYDFKERERFLNKYNHFVTNIQGLDIHYMHVKPEKVPENYEVVPILLLHGWPGSIREFYEMIPNLITVRDGYTFVFEVIAPSLPGYGFSEAPVRPGCGSVESAVIIKNMMDRIGISKYYIQGGDWGHAIGSHLATLFPDNVLGFHTNTPAVLFHPMSTVYSLLGSLWPKIVVEDELKSRMYPLSEKLSGLLEESGYLHLQATKPDTVGIALTDSPAGLAAYILEKFSTWTNMQNKRAVDGNLLNKYSLTHLLDNVMIYWSTGSITTSMRLYAESFSKKQLAMKMDEIPTSVPTWGIKFKHELLFQPDSVLKLKYKNYLQSTHVEDGGHFAALENPQILADDVYLAVDTFRSFSKEQAEYPAKPTKKAPGTIYDFTVKDILGREVSLERYRGHVLLIVNVASQCGFTDRNYKQLNELHEKYSQTRGLRILAFPCNQFNGQEPGSAKDIISFIQHRGVKFDVFDKVNVNGDDAHPLWKFLKESQTGSFTDSIKWNFSKFIVDKNGVPVERFAPTTDPLDLEPYLAKYW